MKKMTMTTLASSLLITMLAVSPYSLASFSCVNDALPEITRLNAQDDALDNDAKNLRNTLTGDYDFDSNIVNELNNITYKRHQLISRIKQIARNCENK